jgi:hypothetical protein
MRGLTLAAILAIIGMLAAIDQASVRVTSGRSTDSSGPVMLRDGRCVARDRRGQDLYRFGSTRQARDPAQQSQAIGVVSCPIHAPGHADIGISRTRGQHEDPCSRTPSDGESAMKVLFDNESFSFETLRTIGFASGTPTKFQFQ